MICRDGKIFFWKDSFFSRNPGREKREEILSFIPAKLYNDARIIKVCSPDLIDNQGVIINDGSYAGTDLISF